MWTPGGPPVCRGTPSGDPTDWCPLRGSHTGHPPTEPRLAPTRAAVGTPSPDTAEGPQGEAHCWGDPSPEPHAGTGVRRRGPGCVAGAPPCVARHHPCVVCRAPCVGHRRPSKSRKHASTSLKRQNPPRQRCEPCVTATGGYVCTPPHCRNRWSPHLATPTDSRGRSTVVPTRAIALAGPPAWLTADGPLSGAVCSTQHTYPVDQPSNHGRPPLAPNRGGHPSALSGGLKPRCRRPKPLTLSRDRITPHVRLHT